MNVLVDVKKAIEDNTLDSDHEFQVFEDPIRHASYNVVTKSDYFSMKSADPYDPKSFQDRLVEILGSQDAKEWHERRLIREQDKIIAAAGQNIRLFNLQEASIEFVTKTVERLNQQNPEQYEAIYCDHYKNLWHNLAIIYNKKELTPVGEPFRREELLPDRIFGQVFKVNRTGEYLVMQNIHGIHYDSAKDGELPLRKAMEFPIEIKTHIERVIQGDNLKSSTSYTVCLSGDTNRRRPPTDDEFKYIAVNTATVGSDNPTFFDDVAGVDYTDGSFSVIYKHGMPQEETFEIANSEILGKEGNPINRIKVSARFALKNNHFKEFPFTTSYTLDGFQQKFDNLHLNGWDALPQKNDYNVCRVKITSNQLGSKDIAKKLEQQFGYVETIKTKTDFQYYIYPNQEITDLKIKNRERLQKSMRSELISLIVQGDKIPLRAAIKEWLEYYPDLLKTVLERNEQDVEQDIFLKASATAKFNLGESWPGHGKLSCRPSISAILHYAAHQVGATDFGDLDQYSAEMKLTYIENHLKDEDLTENDKTILRTMHHICKTDDNYLDVTINLIQSLKTKLEPPKIIKELALNEDANRRKLAKKEYDKEYQEYTTAKEINSAHLNSFLNLPQLCNDIRDEKKKFAKINVAVGVLGALVGGAAVVAILLTAPISLPVIIGISLIGLAVAATFLATFSRAQNFLNEASKYQKTANSFSILNEKISLSIKDKNSSLKTLEDNATEVNDQIKMRKEELEQEEKAINIKNEKNNRDRVEQQITNTPDMNKLQKMQLRYQVLNQEQINILGNIQNDLLGVGKNRDVDKNLTQSSLNLAKLAPDIQIHFQDYLYEETAEWSSILQIGINALLRKQGELFQNTKSSPSDDQSSSNSNKRGWSKFSYEASPKQSPAGLLFTSQEAGSELNKKALEVKNQLRTFKDDSEISYDSPSYTR